MRRFARCGLLLATALFSSPELFAATAADSSLIIDHGDAEYTEDGAWENSGDGWEERGQSYSLSRRTKADGAWAKWTPDLPKIGHAYLRALFQSSKGARHPLPGATLRLPSAGSACPWLSSQGPSGQMTGPMVLVVFHWGQDGGLVLGFPSWVLQALMSSARVHLP